MRSLTRRLTARLSAAWPALILISVIVGSLSPSVSHAAQHNTAPGDHSLHAIHSLGGISEYQLANGLRILLAPDAAQPSVTVNMTYLVGSRHENYGETGMAHLLEHMLFRGTPTLRDALGEFSRRGLQANGTTNSDRTNYYASFAADPDTLDWYLRWQADVMVNALIAREDLDAEMTVVRNEMEQSENSPFGVLMRQLLSTAYLWHNYGKATIGARSDVENVDIDALRAFYATYYQPDNAVLIVSGDFEVDRTLAVIQSAFGDIPRPTRTLPREYTIEPVQDGERTLTLRRAGGSPIVATLYHIPAAGSPDFAPVELGIAMLADEPAGPLYQQLVTPKLATQVFGFTSERHHPGYALLGAILEDGMDPNRTRDALRTILDQLGPDDFTQAELDRVRRQWLTAWDTQHANPAALASNLSEYAALGDWRLYFLQRDRIARAQLDDVRQATLAYLVPDNRSTGVYLPTPNPRRAPAAVPTDLTPSLQGFTPSDLPDTVAAFDTSPQHINAQTLQQTLDLPNGPVKLALLPKPSRGHLVHANLLMQFGDADLLKGTQTIADATADLLERGTRQFSRQQIEDQYTALQAQVSINAAPGQVQIGMSTTAEHLPDLIRLVLHILREPTFPQNEFDNYQRQVATALSNARATPSSVAARALSRHTNPWPTDDVRYTLSFDEEQAAYAALSTDALRAFHQRFYGAGRLLFSAVGEFDPAAITAALTEGLDGWQTAPTYTPIAKPYQSVPPTHQLLDTPDKANAFYLARHAIALQDTDADYPALVLANYLLGGSETSRLWQRVRVKDGLSYTVRSELSASSREASGSWTLYAIHAPDTSEALQSAFEQTLQNSLEQGFTDEEVAQGVTALLNYRKLNRSRDSILARAWLNYLDLDRDFSWSARLDDALQTLNAQTVNQALRQYLHPDQLSSALASDPGRRANSLSN